MTLLKVNELTPDRRVSLYNSVPQDVTDSSWGREHPRPEGGTPTHGVSQLSLIVISNEKKEKTHIVVESDPRWPVQAVHQQREVSLLVRIVH